VPDGNPPTGESGPEGSMGEAAPVEVVNGTDCDLNGKKIVE